MVVDMGRDADRLDLRIGQQFAVITILVRNAEAAGNLARRCVRARADGPQVDARKSMVIRARRSGSAWPSCRHR